MTSRARLVLVSCVLAASLVGCASNRSRPAAKNVSFEKLKSLAGTWTTRDETGKEVIALESRVVSAGSALEERMFPGTDHEMVNMYHQDNGALIVTHYCAMGNQPRMHAVASPNDEFAFRLRDVTNRAKDDGCMGSLTIKVVDQDHIVQHWVSYDKNGKELPPTVFECTRKKS